MRIIGNGLALRLSVVVALAFLASTQVTTASAISAQDLLKAEVFPDAQFGMAVESADDGATARVVTTGGEFIINKAQDTIECRQRIVGDYRKLAQRPVAVISLPSGSLADLHLSGKTSGAAVFQGGGTTVRINCDSLLMVSPGKDGAITAELSFIPDYHMELKGNYNFFDPFGGISFYEHGKHPDSKMYAAADPVKVVWQWNSGDVFWAGISPPKPFDWKASTTDRIVFTGSSVDRYMYPSDFEIAEGSRYGNILYLHNETMWEHWQKSLVPRDKANYLRVMRTAHERGMKTMVYASPHFFTKGTSVESLADPTPEKGIGGFDGTNADEYLAQAQRIVKEYETDGLYFDEIYSSIPALAAEYYVARSARKVVGDSGILAYHATTDALGGGHRDAYCPTLHSYFNFVMKGEGEWNTMDPAYLRYNLCTLGISNAIGMQIVDDRFVPSPERMTVLLQKANARFAFPLNWMYTDKLNLYRDYYWPYLKDGIERWVSMYDTSRYTVIFDQFRQPRLKD